MLVSLKTNHMKDFRLKQIYEEEEESVKIKKLVEETITQYNAIKNTILGFSFKYKG